MKIKKIANNAFCLILQKDDAIMTSIKEFHSSFCEGKFCKISGIGSVNEVTLGNSYVDEDNTIDYQYVTLKGNHEIISLDGNITTRNGKSIAHLHIALADNENHVIGGHLDEAVINILGELIVTVYDTEVTREYDEELGLQVLQ